LVSGDRPLCRLASREAREGGGYGVVGDLVVGVIGALLGGWLFGLLGISTSGLLGSLVTAVVGAVVLIFLLRVLRRG